MADPAALYSAVLEPQPEGAVPRRLKKEALRASCPQASPSALDHVFEGNGMMKPLIDIKRALDSEAAPPAKKRRVSGAAAPAPARGRLPKAAASARGKRLAAMLDEVAAKLPLQEEHEARLDAAVANHAPAPAGRKRQRAAAAADADVTAACSACLDPQPLSSLVRCPYFDEMAGRCPEGARGFCARKNSERHVICPQCLRAYLLSVKLHGGDLKKMVCPGCVTSVRLMVGPLHRGRSLHDLVREPWVEARGPYHPKVVQAVLGPVDLLRMEDLRTCLKNPPPSGKETAEYLRSEGARVCPNCRTPHVKGDGCDAVICELCSVVFDYSKADRL